MRYFIVLVISILFISVGAKADDANYILIIKDHKFSPAELTVPAGQKIKLTLKNQQPSPAEFESEDLSREKLVSANGEITILVGPLSPGKYQYFDDFGGEAGGHHNVTGTIIAK